MIEGTRTQEDSEGYYQQAWERERDILKRASHQVFHSVETGKLRVFVDMDRVLADFDTAWLEARLENPERQWPQSEPGFFASLARLKALLRATNGYMRTLTRGF